jgi:hypothetical protein
VLNGRVPRGAEGARQQPANPPIRNHPTGPTLRGIRGAREPPFRPAMLLRPGKDWDQPFRLQRPATPRVPLAERGANTATACSSEQERSSKGGRAVPSTVTWT